jgi:hypothetical protein
VLSQIVAHRNFSCRITDATSCNPIVVAVNVRKGNQIKKAPVTLYQSHQVEVEFLTADQFESQLCIILKVDDTITRVYTVHEDGLYTQEGKDYFLQCRFS